MMIKVGNFVSLDSGMFLRTLCADSSSPQISAILLGHLTETKHILRKSSATLPQELSRTNIKSWLAKFPRFRPINVVLQRNHEHVFESVLHMLSSSGAGGLVAVRFRHCLSAATRKLQ